MDELDDTLKALANEYHEPPPLDRERVWAQIGERREARGDSSRALRVVSRERRFLAARLVAWGGAVAAVLAIGFVLGRGTAGPADAPAAHEVASGEPQGEGRALALAAAGHMRQAETYLTLFRSSVRGGAPDASAIPAARELLATNRLLASAPGTDPRLRQLLLDLEFVLVQITQLEGSDRPEDVQLITDGLDRTGTLSRLRAATPRYPAPLTTGVS